MHPCPICWGGRYPESGGPAYTRNRGALAYRAPRGFVRFTPVGSERLIRQIAGRRFRLPDGSDRYLVDAALLEAVTADLEGTLVDPLKTTVVHNQRSMTTWVVRKPA